jgi:UDP-glucuronate 4-epimerase
MRYLVTGAAGFIGSHCCQRLLAGGHEVLGIDNLNDYYDPALKRARLARLARQVGRWTFHELDIADRAGIERLFADGRPQRVIHLAAQAGVRASLTAPLSYIEANLVGFANVIVAAWQHKVEHFVYASSSSVYGLNAALPFSTDQPVDHPASLYAATKKANELIAHSYSHCFRLPTTGLRFFTVYGPWGRPDMALYSFTKAIIQGEPIQLYNQGKMRRSFTYIDDIVEGVLRTTDHVAAPDPAFDAGAPDPATSSAPWRIYNIGNHRSEDLLTYVRLLEESLGRTAVIEYLPLQTGDVVATEADISRLQADVGYTPGTPISTGIPRFVAWYREYHNV